MAQSDRRSMVQRVLAETADASAPRESRVLMVRRVLAETEPALAESAVGSAKSFVSGAVRSVSEALRGASELAERVEIPVIDYKPFTREAAGWGAMSAATERLAPDVDPRVANSIPGQIASGLGQVGAMLGGAAINPAIGLEMAFLGGVSETERQIASEMVDEDGGIGLGTLFVGGAIGSADMIPVGGVLARINRVMGGGLSVAALRLAEMQKLAASGGLASTAGRIGGTAALEGGTEALQKLGANALANYATDQELDLLRGVVPEGGVGAGVGGILAGMVELATAKRRGMRARMAQAGLPEAEYKHRYETDAEFRRSEDIALDDMIAEEFGVKLMAPLNLSGLEGEYVQPDVAEGRQLVFEGQAVKERGRQLVTDLEGQPTETRVLPTGDFETDTEAWQKALRTPVVDGKASPGRAPALSLEQQRDAYRRENPPLDFEGNVMEVEPEGYWPPHLVLKPEPNKLPRVQFQPTPSEPTDVARRDDGTPYPPGFGPNPEYRRAGPAGVPQEPTSRSEQAKAPFVPSSAVRSAPSTEAYVPVKNQQGPTGQPVYPITGQRRADAPWGGTVENTIGAKSPTSRTDIGRAMQDFIRGLGEISATVRKLGSDILGSSHAAGSMDWEPTDLHTGAHEVGHLIHRRVMANQRTAAEVAKDPNAVVDQLSPQVQGEIRSLAYAGTTPGSELSEGFAELARLWLLAPEEARTRAPRATQWLEGWVVSQPRNVSAALNLIQKRAQDYRFQGDELRDQIQEPPTRAQVAERAWHGLPEVAVRRIYDDTSSLKRISPKLQDLWRAIRGSARNVLAQLTEGTPVDFSGTAIPNGITMKRILAAIPLRERRSFGNYIHARMALALEGKGVDTGKAPAEAYRQIHGVNGIGGYDRTHPHFRSAFDDMQRWWGQVNKILGDMSPTYQAGLDRIAAHDREYGIDIYVPLHRWITKTPEGRVWQGQRTARGRALKDDVSMERMGSPGEIKDPVDALVVEARNRLEQGVYRNLVERLIEIHDAGGHDDPKVRPYFREITAEEATGKAIDYGPEGSVESMLEALASPELRGDMIPVKIVDPNGKPRFFLMDRRVAETVAQVDPGTLKQGTHALVSLASLSRRTLSTSQIVMNLGFQFFTNLMLDTPMAYLTSSYLRPQDLAELIGYIAVNILRNIRATFIPSGKSQGWVGAYERLGLHANAGYSGERSIGKRTRVLSGGRSTLERGWEGLAAFMSIPQRSVQIALMQKAAKAHKIDILNPSGITLDQANILRLAAKQPVDYLAGGDLSRQWSNVIPFLRPALDSQRQLFEAARRSPPEFLLKLGILSAAYTTLRYAFGDDEIERAKTGSDAMRSISIPAGDEVLEIRVPGEIAWMVLAPIALAESMRANGQDPSDLIAGMARNAAPPGPQSIPVLNLVLQHLSEKQNPVGAMLFGEDAPVVPAALENMDGIAQRTPSTAPVAIAMAEVMNAVTSGMSPTSDFRRRASSPVWWESGIRSVLGGHGLSMVEGFGVVPWLRTGVEPEHADILNGVFRRGGATSWNDRNIRDVFELNRAAIQAKATLNGRMEDPLAAYRRGMLARTCAAIATARYLATYDEASFSKDRRRELAEKAQKVAAQTIKQIKAGEIPTSFYGLEAEVGIGRQLYDLNRGAYGQ